MTDAPAATAASKASSRNVDLGARGVLGAELDVVVGSDQAPRLRHAGADPLEDILGRVLRSLWVMWMSDWWR